MSPFGKILRQGLAHVVQAARERAADLLHDLEERVSAWAGRLALRYGALLLLGLAGVISLLAAAKEGLVAAGLPAWAASLILGVVLTGAAWIVQKQGQGRKSPGSSSGFTVEIHLPPKPEPPGGPRRRKSRPRGHRVVRVKHLAEGWQVDSGRHRSHKRFFSNQRRAAVRLRPVA